MKLLSCYIENYGKISATTFDFNEGLTAFCEKNGYGKTTLASFVKAMFYGLPSYRANTVRFEDRQKFYPFGGGKFGGNLTFEMKGKRYRVERFFDKKSEGKDESRLFVNDEPTNDPVGNLGERIFGLDEESFLRTVFVTSEETEIVATGGINARLNQLVDATDAENNYESAVKALDEKKKKLKLSRGTGGEIDKKREQIRLLSDEIENLEKIAESLSDLYLSRSERAQEILALEAELKKANAQKLERQKWETYDSYVETAEGERKRFSVLSETYRKGVPTEAEAKTLVTLWRTAETEKAKLDALALGEDKEKRFAELTAVFGSGVPERAELDGAQEKITALKLVQAKAAETDGEMTKKRASLDEKRRKSPPLAEELTQKRQTLEAYKRTVAEAKAYADQYRPITAENKSKTPALILAVVAFALVVVGAILLASVLAVGVVLLAVGVTAGVGAAVLAFKRKGTATAVSDGEIRLRAEQARLEEELKAFLVPYGYYSTNGVVFDFSVFENDLKTAEDEARALTELEEKRRSLAAEETSLKAELEAFLRAYGRNEGEAQERLNRLSGDVRAYVELKEEKRTTERERSKKYIAYTEAVGALEEILQKYGLEKEDDLTQQTERIASDSKEYERLKNSAKELAEKAERYARENGLKTRPEEGGDVDGLTEKLNASRLELAQIDSRIAEEEAQTELLPDKYGKLENANEDLKYYQEKFLVYTTAIEALTEAERRLQEKYVAPVKEKFLSYAALLEEALGERVYIDKDFRVSFERNGETRSDKHLSSGQKTLCALCMRLALLENMFGGEKPFVVMDDPFVYLDGEHLERAKKLVTALSEKTQILYFCCHESRAIRKRV